MSGPFTSPTPWLHRNTGGTETVVDRTGQLVCILGRGFEAGNGALIVAAPALKDALRMLDGLLTPCVHNGPALDCPWCAALRARRAALAKSEQDGGAPEDGPVETGTGV